MSTSDQGGGGARPGVAPAAPEILDLLVHRQLDVLGEEFVGSYVFGSAVTEGFDPDVSDADTVAVLGADPSPTQIVELRRMHREIVRVLPVWDDRIEATYLSKEALRAFEQRPWPAAHLSPGEPFHTIELNASWVID